MRNCASKKYSIIRLDPKASGSRDDGVFCEVFYLYKSTSNHDHNQLPNLKKRVTEVVEKRIIDMHKQKKKPQTISLTIRNDKDIPDEQQPSKRQINNTIEKFKKKVFEANPLTMKELTDFVNARMDLPEDPDKPFILTFERSPENQANDKYFRLFVTTNRLLENAQHTKNIHADATEKIMVEKNYLLVVGATDLKRSFHLIGIALSSHQNADSYEFLFRSARLGVRLRTRVNIEPNFVVADADAAIALGAKRVFGDVPVISCYVHLLRNITKRYTFKDSAKNKEQFINDVRTLHMAPFEVAFDNGVKLFVKKWKKKESEVIDRLQRSYFNQNKNWFIGAGFRVPKDNNSTENFNGQYKSYSTEYLKSQPSNFCTTSFQLWDSVRVCTDITSCNHSEPRSK